MKRYENESKNRLVKRELKIELLEEVWNGITEKARKEGNGIEEYIKTLLEHDYVGLLDASAINMHDVEVEKYENFN